MLNSVGVPRARRAVTGITLAVLALGAAACDSDNDSSTGPNSGAARTYNQVQRLGNPLVSEVLLMKRDHGFHGSSNVSADVENFAPKVKGFIAAFRPQAVTLQNTVASVLLPDMLIMQTNKAPSTAGYLSWALADGYGGRKLTDDVVDVSLSAVFSDLLDPTQAVCKPGALPLCTDNVASHGGFTATFPYLATPK